MPGGLGVKDFKVLQHWITLTQPTMTSISPPTGLSVRNSPAVFRHKQPPLSPPWPVAADCFSKCSLCKSRNRLSVVRAEKTMVEGNFIDTKMDLEESISNQMDVSFMLTKDVFSKEVNGVSNLVFSPLLIQLVLGLIASASEGPTRDQLLSFLKSKSIEELNYLYSHIASSVLVVGIPSGGPFLPFANGVWVDKSLSFKPSFKKVANRVYGTALFSVDFQNKADDAVNQVNEWAKDKTNDLIKELILHNKVDNTIRLILANALYFKGAWGQVFNASETKDHEFHLLNGGSVQAPFMTSNNKQYIAAFDGFKILMLPYKRGLGIRNFCMYLLLPDAHDGLPSLVDKISSEPGFFKKHVPDIKVKVPNFLIPKFKLTFAVEASNVLKRLGLTLPFSHCSGITEIADSTLSIEKVFQKASIEVNEEGTEDPSYNESTETEIDFVADHPFLFFVRDESSEVVVLTGTVLNPQAG